MIIIYLLNIIYLFDNDQDIGLIRNINSKIYNQKKKLNFNISVINIIK